MGVVNREDILYLNVTKGKMVNNGRGISVGGYEGTLIGIREKSGEFEGQPTLKIEVKMKDSNSDEIAIVQFTKEAWFALGFFSRIRKINLQKPFTIGVLASKENDKMSFCYLKQEGIVKVEADKSFPKYETVLVNKKNVLDWTKPFDEMDKIVKHITDTLAIHNPAPATNESDPVITANPGNKAEYDDDLPF